jgi:alkylation response protein AidB-like acyl-CoA dehydrogenase
VNFAEMELDADTMAFWRECRAFFDEHVTEATHERERQSGGGFDEELHLEMGKRGWVAPRWPVDEGGAALDPVRARIVEIELDRSNAPSILASTTLLPPVAIRLFAEEAVKAEVLPGVANGTIRICLGSTEPDCGSDLAAVRTRAVRDGDEWVVTGQKMFTTGAQFCQYCFCLTRTNPDAPKHKGLTVFLVPLDLPGIEIRPIDTLGGERTNFVHFDDVRVPDRYRLGDVDQGWAVVSAPLAAEHSLDRGDDEGVMTYAQTTRRLVDAVAQWLETESDPALDEGTVRERLGRAELELEIAAASPGPMGRVYAADSLVRTTSDLLELAGPTGVLPHGADGAVADGFVEYAFRFALGTTIYAGSTDIHRNMIAEHMLGLPRSTPRG